LNASDEVKQAKPNKKKNRHGGRKKKKKDKSAIPDLQATIESLTSTDILDNRSDTLATEESHPSTTGRSAISRVDVPTQNDEAGSVILVPTTDATTGEPPVSKAHQRGLVETFRALGATRVLGEEQAPTIGQESQAIQTNISIAKVSIASVSISHPAGISQKTELPQLPNEALSSVSESSDSDSQIIFTPSSTESEADFGQDANTHKTCDSPVAERTAVTPKPGDGARAVYIDPEFDLEPSDRLWKGGQQLSPSAALSQLSSPRIDAE
jgi:hypothetical protein